MFRHTIKKTVDGSVTTMMNHLLRRPIQQQSSYTQKTWPSPTSVDIEGRMNKTQFGEWFTRHVEGKFAVDDAVTYLHIPQMEGTVPHYWVITYIDEIWSGCSWSLMNRAPENILVCIPGTTTTTSFRKCALSLRKLSEKEKALVLLQNRKVEGHA
jgi:hypothetical protein